MKDSQFDISFKDMKISAEDFPCELEQCEFTHCTFVKIDMSRTASKEPILSRKPHRASL